MDTMEMISKALEQVVEQEVAKRTENVKTLETLQEKLNFIKTFNDDEITSVFNFLKNENETFHNLLDTEYQNRLVDDDMVINKDDIDVDTVEECGILEDCFYRYVENGDEREIIKDLVDRL